MPLILDEPLDFMGWNGSPSRCRVRLFTPPIEAKETGYIVMLTDDAGACGTSITNAAEQLAAILVGRFSIPEQRVTWIEHYDYRHTPEGHDGSGHEQSFARVTFSVPTTAGERFDFIHGTSLGKPNWKHIDRDSVEILIGETLP